MFTIKKHGTERLCLHKNALVRAFFKGSIAPHTNDMRKTEAAKQRRTAWPDGFANEAGVRVNLRIRERSSI